MKALRAIASTSLRPLIVILVTASPANGQNRTIERAGDFAQWGMPVSTLGTTLAIEDYRGSAQFLAGFAATVAVTEGLKQLLPKDRPDGSDDESFPSGHTSIAFQSASFIHLRYGLRYGAPAFAAAAFVGVSRINARKHFIADVLVGLAIGTVSARLATDRKRNEPQPTVALAASFHFGS